MRAATIRGLLRTKTFLCLSQKSPKFGGGLCGAEVFYAADCAAGVVDDLHGDSSGGGVILSAESNGHEDALLRTHRLVAHLALRKQ